MRRIGLLFYSIILLLAVGNPAHAFSFICEGRIIEIGDSKAEVGLKCGTPTWSESWGEQLIEKTDPIREHRAIITHEEWGYNLGPNRLIHFLEFRGNRLVNIRTGGYGFVEGSTYSPDCSNKDLDLGLTKTEVLVKCGKPSWEDTRQEEVIEKTSPISKRRVFLTYDEWTYNFGPNSLLRIITFENGKLIEDSTGERGF